MGNVGPFRESILEGFELVGEFYLLKDGEEKAKVMVYSAPYGELVFQPAQLSDTIVKKIQSLYVANVLDDAQQEIIREEGLLSCKDLFEAVRNHVREEYKDISLVGSLIGQDLMIEEVESSGDIKSQKAVKKNKSRQIGKTLSAGMIKAREK